MCVAWRLDGWRALSWTDMGRRTSRHSQTPVRKEFAATADPRKEGGGGGVHSALFEIAARLFGRLWPFQNGLAVCPQRVQEGWPARKARHLADSSSSFSR